MTGMQKTDRALVDALREAGHTDAARIAAEHFDGVVAAETVAEQASAEQELEGLTTLQRAYAEIEAEQA